MFCQAKYSCEEPTVIEGGDNSISTCRENGEWAPVALTCHPVICGSAPSVSNSDVIYEKTPIGFSAHYTCHEGFVLKSGK